jgi:hypothetical protein
MPIDRRSSVQTGLLSSRHSKPYGTLSTALAVHTARSSGDWFGAVLLAPPAAAMRPAVLSAACSS